MPNLVISPLILAQYTLVSLFPYLRSHWAQNLFAYLWYFTVKPRIRIPTTYDPITKIWQV